MIGSDGTFCTDSPCLTSCNVRDFFNFFFTPSFEIDSKKAPGCSLSLTVIGIFIFKISYIMFTISLLLYSTLLQSCIYCISWHLFALAYLQGFSRFYLGRSAAEKSRLFWLSISFFLFKRILQKMWVFL